MKLADQNRERESGRGLFANSTCKLDAEGVVLTVDGTPRHLTAEQVVAMFLLPLKTNADVDAAKPLECVFTLPACAGNPRVTPDPFLTLMLILTLNLTRTRTLT